MNIFPLLDRRPSIIGGIEQFGSKPVLHTFSAARSIL
jgi:hypothetical protein